jgi:hypothetical protein
MDFNTLKKNRGSVLNALQNELDEVSGKKEKKSYKDDRFWQPTVDDMGNGGAIIRFLPDRGGDVPFTKLWSHGFKGPTGQWYIENSRTTLGESDPVAEFNSKLWNSGNQDQARSQKRRLHFISNILVVKDAAKPENNGKVFLYKYGKKIFEKIEQSINPPFDDEGRTPTDKGYDPSSIAVDPFDMWEGANFRILIRQVDGFRNYDMSKFDASKSISSDDDEIKEIWEQTYELSEFTDEKNFKSYDELNARLAMVMGFETDFADTNSKNEAETPPKSDKPAPKASVEEDDDDIDLDKYLEDLG